jgi:hypothetical protein
MKNPCNKNPLRVRSQALLARCFSTSIILALVFSHSVFAAASESIMQQKRKPQPQKSKPKPEGDKPQPWLSIDKTEHNFGEVFAGEELEHVFTVRNTGTAPLELFDGGPVAALERPTPDRLLRTVSFTGSRHSLSGRFMLTAAAMRAAPS